MGRAPTAPDCPPTWRDRTRKAARRLFPWVALVIILYYLFARVPLEDVLAEFASMDSASVVGLCVLSLVFIVGVSLIDGVAMWYGFSLFGVPLRLREITLVRAAMMLLASIMTPIGQAGLAAHISAKYKVPGRPAAGMVTYLFLIEAYGMVAVATLSLPLFLLFRYGGEVSGAPLMQALFMIGLAWPALIIFILLGRRATGVGIIESLGVAPVLEPLCMVGGKKFLTILGLKTILAAWQIGLTVLAFRIYGIHAPAADLYAFMPLAILVSSLPVAPGRLGITQVSWVFFFGYLASAPSLVALSLLLQFILNVARWMVGAVALPFVYSDLWGKQNCETEETGDDASISQ